LVRGIFPESRLLPVAATAFVAVLPMHITFTSAVNNDTLAELLYLCVLWQTTRALREGLTTRAAVVTGICLGLALLTKTTTYTALALVAAGALLNQGAENHNPPADRRSTSQYLVVVFVLAASLSLPWFFRNAVTYGDWDVLGWKRHDSIVEGQLRSLDLLHSEGLSGLVKAFLVTTFRSFWGQFGWMGVLMDHRVYLALALVSGLLGIGFLAFLVAVREGRIRLTPHQQRSMLLLGICVALVILQYVWYNLKFVQHQGRYLFPALGPIALGAALGLREILQPRNARRLAAGLLVAGLLPVANGVASSDPPMWTLAILVGGAAFLASAGWLSSRRQPIILGVLYAALVALDCVCLLDYIVPHLS
jgi:4-amino-4-deoxy-L-arabinose transferase-like glycosyltransferase